VLRPVETQARNGFPSSETEGVRGPFRPLLRIFDGTLHNMEPSLRQIFLRRLCAKDEPWAAIFVTNHPSSGEYVDHRVTIG
jgi:hypothetical protein